MEKLVYIGGILILNFLLYFFLCLAGSKNEQMIALISIFIVSFVLFVEIFFFNMRKKIDQKLDQMKSNLHELKNIKTLHKETEEENVE